MFNMLAYKHTQTHRHSYPFQINENRALKIFAGSESWWFFLWFTNDHAWGLFENFCDVLRKNFYVVVADVADDAAHSVKAWIS